MFLHVAGKSIELAEPENFRSFKVVVRGTAAELPRARESLAGIAELTDSSTAWVSAETLRNWPTVKNHSAWQQGLAAMIEKARPHGWIDPQSGAVKAHVEWQDTEPARYEDDIELLRNGLKQAMRRLASTVTIITTNDNGVPYGMTATAVTSLTMDPPSLVICLNKEAGIHDPLLRSGAFCVNLLRPGHEPLSSDFSGKKVGQKRFESGNWEILEQQAPYLADAQSSIFCDVQATLPYGTHTIVVGRVTKVLVAESVMPLVHHNGRYGQFAPL